MKVLIVGGAGFAGSRTALRLLSEGHEPFVLDCLDPQVHGEHPATSSNVLSLSGAVEILRGDSRDPDAVERSLKRAEAVFYLPAATGTGQSMYQVERYCDVNVRGSGVFAEALSRHRAALGRVIVSSSRAVYWEGAATCREHGRVFPTARQAADLTAGRFETTCPLCGQGVTPEASRETDPEKPDSIYGITKLAQEQIIARTAQNLEIPCVVFRYQNVYGPGQSLKNPYTGILAIFSQLARAGREINLFEDGLSTRDFVYVDDVVEYNVRALTAPLDAGVTLNVGSGERISLERLVDFLGNAMGIATRYFVSGQFRLGDIRHATADVSILRATLGPHEFCSISDGLLGFAQWLTGEQDAGTVAQRFDRSLDEMREAGLLRQATALSSAGRFLRGGNGWSPGAWLLVPVTRASEQRDGGQSLLR